VFLDSTVSCQSFLSLPGPEFLNLRSSKVNGTIPDEFGELSHLGKAQKHYSVVACIFSGVLTQPISQHRRNIIT
jgi:hypothetical protein